MVLNCRVIYSKTRLRMMPAHCLGLRLVRPGSLKPVDRGELGRIVKTFKSVHTFPEVLRTRPSLGQK